MANDIVDYDDALYGYMDGGWWRPERVQSERNARVMEHVSTLSWFYASERDWNPHYKDAPLLARLNAAVGYYVSLQRPDGSYPEYDDSASLAATGFGLVAQAEAYELLESAGGAEESLHLLSTSMTRALNWVLDADGEHWSTPIVAFNQLSGALVGAQRALQVLPESMVSQAAIDERLVYLCEQGQAPAGFLNELYGVDFEYNFTVTMPDLAWLYRHTQNASIVGLVKRYMEFMRYAVIPEPSGGELMHVPALHTRNPAGPVSRPPEDLLDRAALAKLFLDEVPDIALFLPTRGEKDDVRTAFVRDSQPLIALEKPHTSPRTWMYGPIAPEGPTTAQRDAIEGRLPLLQADRFTKLESGSLNDQYLFIRRPDYYLVGVFGEHQAGQLSTRQLGTLWHPDAGTILTGTNVREGGEGWETRTADGSFSTRRSSSTSVFHTDLARSREIAVDRVSELSDLITQRAHGQGVLEYATAWNYWDRGVRYRFWTEAESSFTHRMPLVLKSDDVLTFSDGRRFTVGDKSVRADTSSLTLTRGDQRVLFSFGPELHSTYVNRSEVGAAGGVIHRVGILFASQLVVDITFLSAEQTTLLGAEAFAGASGQVSLRVTIDPEANQSVHSIDVTGEGVQESSTTLEPGSTTVEQTVNTSGVLPSQLNVVARSATGSAIDRLQVPVRGR
ncbi:hypothetical protein [Pseudoclavibacter sp. VKM Ac-2867]|uniref:hypothetical protein n=1 Tax=Pseudoclavibacter sp. VKM Ac-2867 TaxID=2783829 RepID=UPI00188B9093|nr:hypothetical protein [Pseudoclavibacter sp. VKM Ac-2867]MBF4457338.1 hypothetical protein [Pseudoclavibacter sp. VKM Ac-2867]